MKGTNERLPAIKANGDIYLVREMFPTIQGEGPLVGTPAVFLRLAGCNLACSFCDTDFEVSRSSYSDASMIWETAKRMARGAKLLVVTGGEPARWDLAELIRLRPEGWIIQIETSGSLPLRLGPIERASHQKLVGILQIVVSPKTHGVHPSALRFAGAWKYVMPAECDLTDSGIPIVAFQAEGKAKPLFFPGEAVSAEDVFIQPCDYGFDTTLTARSTQRAVEVCREHGYRLSIQTHKLLGLP